MELVMDLEAVSGMELLDLGLDQAMGVEIPH